jgi:hypothetical protein
MGSDSLFAWPSFASGVARTLDLGGQFDEYNDSPNGAVADWRALFSDWQVVGLELAAAMTSVIGKAKPDGAKKQEST